MLHSDPYSRTRAMENVSVLRPKNIMAAANLTANQLSPKPMQWDNPNRLQR
jgi:hypothetical protein